MNGARSLLQGLVAAGVDTCFMNPGTSEMHFVAALDDVPAMRGVLGLFEGVVTGAADGYGRIAGRPAAALLHLGPGLGNGIANLHNARRAHSPVVTIVGDHATYHKAFDAPLESDIDSLARPVSGWLRRPASPASLAVDAAAAVEAASGPPGTVATLIVPADISWSDVVGDGSADGAPAGTGAPRPVEGAGRWKRDGAPAGDAVDGGTVDEIAKILRSGEPAALLVGGRATCAEGLFAAAAVSQATGAKLLCETFPANLERGAGVPAVERLAYLAEMATAQLEGLRHLILVDAKSPVSFFAYPGKPSDLVPEGCGVRTLATGADDVVGALSGLQESVGGSNAPTGGTEGRRPEPPAGPLTAQAVAAALGAALPEGAIVSDEGNTAGLFVSGETAHAPRHNWLCLTGGAIGQGLPVATGAALAAPDRPVVALEADGSAMYTLQALWTQAREGLDVTTIVFDNGSYAILELELSRVGAGASGERARAMLDLDRPRLDFVSLAQGMGVPAARVTTAEEMTAQLAGAFAEDGPHVIQAVLGKGLF